VNRWNAATTRILVLAACAVELVGCTAAAAAEHGPGPVVVTASGTVRGSEQDGLRRFRGLPYAAPPTGQRRWQPPQLVNSWSGIRDATKPGPACLQPEASDMPAGTPQSEDCLTLEVTAPAEPGDNRPVMVWIPGGGFITGAGSIYDPARLVRAGKVVVVTVNYRLGVFGFFAHPQLGDDSNFGLQDQIAALRWVRANIARFGGDPGRITLAGASAGAMSTCTLMTSPSARGLFHRAIIQSGSCLTNHPAGALGEGVAAISSWHPLSTIQGTGQAVTAQLSCGDVACLRDKPAGELLPYTTWFPLIAYGTTLLPQEPAKVFAAGGQAAIPIVQGNTHDEHVEFVLTTYPAGITAKQYSDLLKTAFGTAARRVERQYPAPRFPSPEAAASRVFSDRDWICPSWKSSRYHAKKAPTYAYVFSDPSAPTPSGQPLPAHVRPATAHGAETFYLFDFPDGLGLTADQQRVAGQLVGYWTRFIRTGNPNGAGMTNWPGLDASDTAFRLGADRLRPIDLKITHHCDLWF
jgi:para-nitrobenzyl esterase